MTKEEFIAWAREVGPKYQFNPEVAGQLSQVELVTLVGPTGAGKTTLINELGMPIVKSDVTRDRRPDERRDDTYNFRSDYDKMRQEIESGQYVQFVVREFGEFYGTLASSYPSSGQCTMALVAQAVPSFERFGFKKMPKIYVMPPGYVEWLRRIGSVRSHDISDRLEEARSSLKMAIRDKTYTFILNDDVKMALEDIRTVLNGEELNEHRTQLINETANLLLKNLGDQGEEDLYL